MNARVAIFRINLRRSDKGPQPLAEKRQIQHHLHLFRETPVTATPFLAGFCADPSPILGAGLGVLSLFDCKLLTRCNKSIHTVRIVGGAVRVDFRSSATVCLHTFRQR